MATSAPLDETASVDSTEEPDASIARLAHDEDGEMVEAVEADAASPRASTLERRTSRRLSTPGSSRRSLTSPAGDDDAVNDDQGSSSPTFETGLAASIKEWANAGYMGDALGFLADEVSAIRVEQLELRQTVNSLAGRVEAAIAGLSATLAAGASLRSGDDGRRASPARLSNVSGSGSPGTDNGSRPPSPRALSSRSAAMAKAGKAARGHRFAAPLGLSTSPDDDAPRVPVHVWSGTWNVGASEPVGGTKGCKREDLERFAPKGYDVYVLGVQEGTSDRLYHEFAAATGTVRLRLTEAQKRASFASTGSDAEASGAAGGSTTGASSTSAAASAAAPAACGATHAEEAASSVALAARVADADKVLGRGDGSLVSLKFTGIAVFVSASSLGFVRVMRADRLSFGATEGSKGAVAVVLRIHGSTVAFVSVHLASHKVPARLVQYRDVCKSLGAKIGNSFFQLNEQFHHVVFMGDYNYRCERISGDDALALIRRGAAHSRLQPEFDSMVRHRRETRAWDGYDEPPMAPTLWPTYKKFENRPHTDTTVGGWAASVYRIKFREPVYKGGRVMDRVPGWCDRILARSHPHLRPFFFPLTRTEAQRVAACGAAETDPAIGAPVPSDAKEAASIAREFDLPTWALGGAAEPIEYGDDGSGINPDSESSYDAVNDVLTVSDHSPVRCVFRLLAFRRPGVQDASAGQLSPEAALAAVPVALRPVAARSRGLALPAGLGTDQSGSAASGFGFTPHRRSAADKIHCSAVPPQPPSAPGHDGVTASASLGPLPSAGSTDSSCGSTGAAAVGAAPSVQAVLRFTQIEFVQGEGSVLVPQVAKILCPAPFELDDSSPTEVRVSKTKAGLSGTATLTASDPALLPRLHALVKVQVDRNSKGHCVVPLRPLFAALHEDGEADHTYFTPVACDGITRLDAAGRHLHIQFRASLQLRVV